jgi:hypothetical protein
MAKRVVDEMPVTFVDDIRLSKGHDYKKMAYELSNIAITTSKDGEPISRERVKHLCKTGAKRVSLDVLYYIYRYSGLSSKKFNQKMWEYSGFTVQF